MARMPFNSLAQLRSILRIVPGFAKQKYPEHVGSRTARSPLANACIQIQQYLLQFLFSPVFLLFQMFPKSYSEYSVLTTGPKPAPKVEGDGVTVGEQTVSYDGKKLALEKMKD